ncbi:hypothetical protein L6R52_33865 [Myxococcota bacterium]|nr:hypothetical protein [Myxococcota bacterium]
MRRALAALAAVSATAAGLLLVASQPACSPKRCDYDTKSPETAVISIQCPSGDVCYQGDCRRACQPGREGAQECIDDRDCTDPALPNCVSSPILGSSYCSVCETSDVCVPTLGVCQPVVDVILPEPPSPDRTPPPPLPLDAGAVDGYVFPREDENEPPTPQAITHIGSVRLAELVDLTDGVRREGSYADIRFFDVRTGTTTGEPVKVVELGQCEILLPTRYSVGVSADVGDIRVEDDEVSEGAITAELNATFDEQTGRYVVMPSPLPRPLLGLSVVPSDNRFLSLFSPGLMGVTRPWPGQRLPYHVPFELEPDAATIALLSAAIVVADPPQDLRFQWTGIPRNVGAVGGEKVSFQISGGAHVLRCSQTEGLPQSVDYIDVPAQILGDYRNLEMLAPGDEREIVLERIFEQRLEVTPDSDTIVVDATLGISHSFLGTIRF